MRPNVLLPLFAEATSLKGVGARLAALLRRLLGRTGAGEEARVIDLLLHVPTGVIDRRARPTVAGLVPGQVATLDVTVLKHVASPPGSHRPYRIVCEDDTGVIDLVYFHADRRYLEKLLPVGERRIVSGRIEAYAGTLQMPHPDHVVTAEELARLPLIEPIYPLTGGLSARVLQRVMAQALSRVPEVPEWQDPVWRQRRHWPSFPEALRALHRPQSEADVRSDAGARLRLAYDELLANQLALALVRRHIKRTAGRPLKGDGRLRGKLLAVLPFALTGSQQAALAEIDADMAAPHRMVRLLQGDVGSGKTVVAVLAAATAVEAGTQAALMAPTEVLARQHFNTVAPLALKAGIRVALLTGREKGRDRSEVLAALAEGRIDILVGTHALFQEQVAFKDLGLVIIDEQHRFGVHQRMALQAKGAGAGPDVLVMTATPIPRTLLLTHFGDMDASQLRDKPPGRQPIVTRALPLERIGRVIDRLEEAVARGAQAYWVCPLVEESEQIDVAAAEARYTALKLRFGERVGLVHGRLPAREKDRAMAAFAAGELAILVATTVIEVGVDVPNATIMVIEHAERFGLAQLHQLRGRVGRGQARSACLLLYQTPLGQTARARLDVLCATEDGFRIAEEDLRLRGGGELLGTRQSGTPAFRLARLPEDEALLAAARDDARLILASDPQLDSERGQALRLLLYLFERDTAIRLIRAG